MRSGCSRQVRCLRAKIITLTKAGAMAGAGGPTSALDRGNYRKKQSVAQPCHVVSRNTEGEDTAGSGAEVAPPGPAGQDGLSRVVRAWPGRPTRPISHCGCCADMVHSRGRSSMEPAESCGEGGPVAGGRSPHHSLRSCCCSNSHVLPDLRM